MSTKKEKRPDWIASLWRAGRDAAAAALPCVCRPRRQRIAASSFGAENLPRAAFLLAPRPLRVRAPSSTFAPDLQPFCKKEKQPKGLLFLCKSLQTYTFRGKNTQT